MVFFELNYPAIFVSALLYLGIAALWYSPLVLGRTWMQANRFSDDDLEKRGMFPAIAYALVAAIVLSLGLALLIHLAGYHSWFGGALMGLFASLLISVPAALPVYVFEGRSIRLFIVNEGMPVLAMLIMGAVIGGWN